MDHDKDDRHARRLFPGEPLGRWHHLARVEQREFGEPAGASAHHPIAGLDAAHVAADLDHFAGGVTTSGARFGRRLTRSNPHRVESAEFRTVQRRGVHPD